MLSGGGNAHEEVCSVDTLMCSTTHELCTWRVCAANSDEFALREDFQRWKRGIGFCFCWYPFVFEAASKAALLDIENQGEQVCRCVHCDAWYLLLSSISWPL